MERNRKECNRKLLWSRWKWKGCEAKYQSSAKGQEQHNTLLQQAKSTVSLAPEYQTHPQAKSNLQNGSIWLISSLEAVRNWGCGLAQEFQNLTPMAMAIGSRVCVSAKQIQPLLVFLLPNLRPTPLPTSRPVLYPIVAQDPNPLQLLLNPWIQPWRSPHGLDVAWDEFDTPGIDIDI